VELEAKFFLYLHSEGVVVDTILIERPLPNDKHILSLLNLLFGPRCALSDVQLDVEKISLRLDPEYMEACRSLFCKFFTRQQNLQLATTKR
jgi:hypothetical protein